MTRGLRIHVVNKTRDSVLGARVEIADRWWTRLRGFLRRPPPAQGEGLLLSPCRGVHMWGVKFPLDVIFVDRHGRVVAIYGELQPGKRTSYHFGAEHALEVPAGTIAATGTQVGDLLAWLPADANPADDGPADTPRPEPGTAPGVESMETPLDVAAPALRPSSTESLSSGHV